MARYNWVKVMVLIYLSVFGSVLYAQSQETSSLKKESVSKPISVWAAGGLGILYSDFFNPGLAMNLRVQTYMDAVDPSLFAELGYSPILTAMHKNEKNSDLKYTTEKKVNAISLYAGYAFLGTKGMDKFMLKLKGNFSVLFVKNLVTDYPKNDANKEPDTKETLYSPGFSWEVNYNIDNKSQLSLNVDFLSAEIRQVVFAYSYKIY